MDSGGESKVVDFVPRSLFARRETVEAVELGESFAPKFDANGLVPAIVIDAEGSSVLMLGYMSAEALERTLRTRQAHFWSRSRAALLAQGRA